MAELIRAASGLVSAHSIPSGSQTPQSPPPVLSKSPEPESKPESNDDDDSIKEKIGDFFEKGIDAGKDGILKQKLKFQRSLGLGQRPSVIPVAAVEITGEPRTVEIGWHPVAGFAGKWFADQTGFGRLIKDGINRFPDPTQHWAVLVGEYAHQLWMDESFHVIYINEKYKRDEWHTFEVGKSRFNDAALCQAGEMTIFSMREKRPSYNLINNNCQNFAVNLLEQIKIGSHRHFATAFSVYQRAIGAGTIKDLFVDNHPDEKVEERPSTPPQGTTQLAQQVMDENTTKVDNHHSWFSSMGRSKTVS